jgi:nickel/cobalt transporter (NiCoT) family protein
MRSIRPPRDIRYQQASGSWMLLRAGRILSKLLGDEVEDPRRIVMTVGSTTSTRPRWDRFRHSLTPREWTRVGAMVGFIVLLYVLGWGIFILAILPQHFKLLGIGVAITAYTLGLRHAFDADHISAIDNTTRKLMAEGKRPLSTGFWFSLGHSTVVFVLGIGLTFAARAIINQVSNANSTVETFGGIIGTLVSGIFLYLIAILNLVILVGIIKVFREMRRGRYNDEELEAQLNARGLMFRFFGKLMRSIHSPWQMYPVGVLFGLGFDTATEVALLAATAGAATAGLPWYAVLSLPILFAAGMATMDTADGSFMNFAYGWAFSKPVRKVYYNITITGLSVAVAMLIGTIEIFGLLAQELNLNGGFWSFMSNFNINEAGFFIVGLFVLTWVVALAVWRFGNIERRWEEAAASRRSSSA